MYNIGSRNRPIKSVLLFTILVLLSAMVGEAQVIVTSVPADGTTGVSASNPVVFTFSSPMDSAQTSVSFYSQTPPGAYATMDVWNASFTVLTCTPMSPFPSSVTISWFVMGTSAGGAQAFAQGSFTTGTGSGGGGAGTNAVTTFSLGKIHSYDQYTAGAPNPDTNAPFAFTASTTLASNRTATAVALMLPNAAVSNLTALYGHPEHYNLFYFTAVSNQLESTYPQGTYQFQVSSSQSNQTVAVPLPATMAQPGVPHISNFSAAQAVNPNQPFTLTWEGFADATATDFVYVMVGDWQTPDPGTAGALAGTATSVIIPAGVLSANSNYTGEIGFYRTAWTSNTTYKTVAYRATVTLFNVETTSGTVTPPVISNMGWSNGAFGFDVGTTSGQTLTVFYSTNLSVPESQWQVLTTTTSSGSTVHFDDPHSSTNAAGFYRVRNGT